MSIFVIRLLSIFVDVSLLVALSLLSARGFLVAKNLLVAVRLLCVSYSRSFWFWRCCLWAVFFPSGLSAFPRRGPGSSSQNTVSETALTPTWRLQAILARRKPDIFSSFRYRVIELHVVYEGNNMAVNHPDILKTKAVQTHTHTYTHVYPWWLRASCEKPWKPVPCTWPWGSVARAWPRAAAAAAGRTAEHVSTCRGSWCRGRHYFLWYAVMEGQGLDHLHYV